MKKPSFAAAMISYVAMAILAGVTFDGPSRYEKLFRVIVWLMLAAFAVLTWTHKLRQERAAREEQENLKDHE